VKYPRLEYKTGNLLLILPTTYENEITIIQKHKDWIQKKKGTIQKARQEAKEKNLVLIRTDEALKKLIHSIIEKYKKAFNFKIEKIYFRRMKTKWGSFSSKGNLTINTLLKFLPKGLIEYVIFHELAHSQERKHNERFWRIVMQKFRNYQTKEKDLLVYWFLVQDRLVKVNDLPDYPRPKIANNDSEKK
jgi:predicted metal-dependent hydrolase